MSLRRPKMQIKPKVSTRAMTSKTANERTDINNKPTNELSTKSEDISTKESLLKTIGDNHYTPLTTQITPVSIEETTEPNDKNNNICENEVIFENRDQLLDKSNENNETIVYHKEVINEETNQTIEKESEVESKPKDSEIKTKCLTKVTKETNRKRRMSRKCGQTSDKSVMRMKDLLLYNPPMTEEQKDMRDKDGEQTDKAVNSECTDVESNKVETNDLNDTNCETNAGPRVKVGADGLLILDEESVIVKRKKSETSKDAVIERAGTTSACSTNYSSFRTKTKGSSKPRWSEHETTRFYSALNTIGTDFTLMANLFFRGKRSRLDLRNKFKKEEKVNKLLIDEALFSPNNFMTQCPELEDLLNDSSSDSEEEIENQSVSVKQKSTKSKT